MSRLSSTTLRIGDPAPPLALAALDEQPLSLAEVLREGPVLLAFAPGGWSPNFRRQLAELSAAHPELQAAGVEVVVVATEDARSLRKRLAPRMPPFPILADEHRQAARDYGVYRALSWEGIGVSRPAAFLIDRSGSIRFLYVGEGDADVPETEALVFLAARLLGPGEAEAPLAVQTEQAIAEQPAPSALAPEATAEDASPTSDEPEAHPQVSTDAPEGPEATTSRGEG